MDHLGYERMESFGFVVHFLDFDHGYAVHTMVHELEKSEKGGGLGTRFRRSSRSEVSIGRIRRDHMTLVQGADSVRVKSESRTIWDLSSERGGCAKHDELHLC